MTCNVQETNRPLGRTERLSGGPNSLSRAIAEINVAVRQMDEMTQHNAALVEETNAAIEQTENQAGELERLISTFRVSEDLRGRRPTRAA